MSRISRRLSLQPTSSAPPRGGGGGDKKEGSSRTYKLLLLGSGSVGKTQLLNRLLSQPFSDRYHRTIEELHLLETPGLRLEILDTAGSYEFPAMRQLNIVNSDGYLVVFDVGEVDTLEEAAQLTQLIHTSTKSRPSPPRVTIAANKTDLLQNTELELLTNSRTYARLQSEFNLVQTSALSGDGCEKLWGLVVGELATVEKLRRVSIGEVVKEEERRECRVA